MNRKLLGTYLKQLKISCTCAQNGRQALELLEENTYDLLLLDIQMPLLDGLSVIRHIRRHPALKNLYVIAVTAYSMPGDNLKYLEAGCDDYLAKPVDKNVFRNKILSLAATLAQTATESPDPQNREAVQAVYISLPHSGKAHYLRLIEKLKKNRKIFDEDMIKELADQLLALSPEKKLVELHNKLYALAGNYDLKELSRVITELEQVRIIPEGETR